MKASIEGNNLTIEMTVEEAEELRTHLIEARNLITDRAVRIHIGGLDNVLARAGVG